MSKDDPQHLDPVAREDAATAEDIRHESGSDEYGHTCPNCGFVYVCDRDTTNEESE